MSHHLYNTHAFGNKRSTQEQYRFLSPVDEDPQRPPYLTESTSRLGFSGGSVRISDAREVVPSFPPQSVSYRPERSRSTSDQVTEGDIDMRVNRQREEMNIQTRGQDVHITSTHRDMGKIYPVASDCTSARHLDRYPDAESSSSSLDWLEDVKRATATCLTPVSSSDSSKYAGDTDKRKLFSDQESNISRPRRQDYVFADEQSTPPKISQSRYTSEIASKILLNFGLEKEDLEYFAAFPEDQITSDNLPFILRYISVEKAKKTTPAVESKTCEEPKIYQPDAGLHYGHSKEYAEHLVDETPKTTYTRFHSGSSMVKMDASGRTNRNQLVVENVEAVKSYRTSQTSTVTIPNISSTSNLPCLPPPSHDSVSRFHIQPIQTSQVIPGSITQPKKDAEGRVHSAEALKQSSDFVSPGGQSSQYGFMMPDSNYGKDIKHQGQTQAKKSTVGQQMKVQQTPKPEMTQVGQTRRPPILLDIKLVSPASNFAGVADTTGVAQHPGLHAATQVIPQAAQQPSPRVLSAEAFKQSSDFVSPGGQPSQYGFMMSDSNCGKDIKHQGQTQAEGSRLPQQMKVQQTQKLEMTQMGQRISGPGLFDKNAVPSASPQQPIPSLLDIVTAPASIKVPKPRVKRFFTVAGSSDDPMAVPKQFPHSCLLCQTDCFNLKDWLAHQTSSVHRENCRLIQEAPAKSNDQTSGKSLSQISREGHRRDENDNAPLSHSANQLHLHGDGNKNRSKRSPHTSRHNYRSRSRSRSPRNDSRRRHRSRSRSRKRRSGESRSRSRKRRSGESRSRSRDRRSRSSRSRSYESCSSQRRFDRKSPQSLSRSSEKYSHSRSKESRSSQGRSQERHLSQSKLSNQQKKLSSADRLSQKLQNTSAKKKEATAPSSNKEAVMNEAKKSNSSAEHTGNTPSAQTSAANARTRKRKIARQRQRIRERVLQMNQPKPGKAAVGKNPKAVQVKVNATCGKKSQIRGVHAIGFDPAVKKSQSFSAAGFCNVYTSSELSSVKGSMAHITRLPKYYEGCYTEEDIATILKPFGFEHKHNTIYVLPQSSMAFFMMPSSCEMDKLMSFIKKNALNFKGSELHVKLVKHTIGLSPLQFYKVMMEMNIYPVADSDESIVYVWDISPSEAKHLTEALGNIGSVVKLLPLLNKMFIQFRSPQDADRIGVWYSLLKTAPSYKITRLKIPDPTDTVACPISADKALPNAAEAACGATVPQPTTFPPLGTISPFWITLRASPYIFPTVSPWFITPRFLSIQSLDDITRSTQDAESRGVSKTDLCTIMITGLPEENYTYNDIASVFWPCFTKGTLRTLYYNVMVLALQRRAFIHFQKWSVCVRFLRAHVSCPLRYQGLKLGVHLILEPTKPDPSEEMMYKSMMKLSSLPLSNPDTLEERLLCVEMSEMTLDTIMYVMEVVGSIAPVASFLPLANRICIEMADSRSVSQVLTQTRLHKPPSPVNSHWSMVGPFITMKALKRHLEKFNRVLIKPEYAPAIQDDETCESQRLEDLEKTTEKDAKNDDEKPTDEAENVNVSGSLDDTTGEQMDDKAQQTGPHNSTILCEESRQVSDSVTEEAKSGPKGDNKTELGPSSEVPDSVPKDQITISEKDSDLVKDDEVTGKALSEEKAAVDKSDINSTPEETNESEDTTEEQSSQDLVTEDEITIEQKDGNLVKDSQVECEDTTNSQDSKDISYHQEVPNEDGQKNDMCETLDSVEGQIHETQCDQTTKKDFPSGEEEECHQVTDSVECLLTTVEMEPGKKRKSTKKGGAALRSEEAAEKRNIPTTRAASRSEGKSPIKQETVIKKYATRRNKDTTGGAPTTDTDLVNISEQTVPPSGEDEPVPDTVTIESPAIRRSARRNKDEKITLTVTEASNKRNNKKEGTCQTVESMNVPTRRTRSGRGRTETTTKTDASTENIKTVQEGTPTSTVHTASDSQERNEATPKEGNEVTQQLAATNSDIIIPVMIKDQDPAQISDSLEDEGVKDDLPAPRPKRGRPKKNVKVSKTDRTKSNNGSDPPENIAGATHQFLESVDPQTASDVTPTEERKDEMSPKCDELTKISESISGPPKNKEEEVETVCQIDRSVEDGHNHKELAMTEESDKTKDEILKNDQEQSNISESISGPPKNKEELEEPVCQTDCQTEERPQQTTLEPRPPNQRDSLVDSFHPQISITSDEATTEAENEAGKRKHEDDEDVDMDESENFVEEVALAEEKEVKIRAKGRTKKRTRLTPVKKSSKRKKVSRQDERDMEETKPPGSDGPAPISTSATSLSDRDPLREMSPTQAVCKQEEFEPEAKRPCSWSPCVSAEPFKPGTPFGEEFLVPTLGLFCKVCSVFCLNESSASQSHCSSQTHHDNLQKHYQNLQQTVPKP